MKPTYEELQQRIARLEQMLTNLEPEPDRITDLEEQNRIFEAIVSQSPAAIHITNELGEIIYVNNAYNNLLGYPSEEMNDGLMLSILQDEESLSKYEEIKQFIQKGKVWNGDLRMARKDRQVIWVRVMIFPLVDGGKITNFVAILNDVTRIKLIEAEKQQQEYLYRTLVENLPLAIAIFDKNGKILYANGITEKFLRGEKGSITGKTAHQIYPKEVADDMVKLIRQVFKTGQPVNVNRNLILFGQSIHLKVTRSPLFDEHGKVKSVLAIGQNITEQVRNEKLLGIQHQIDSLSNLSTSLQSSLKRAFQHLLEVDWIDGGGIYLFDEDRKKLRLIFSTGFSKEFTGLVSLYTSREPPVKVVLKGKPMYAGTDDFFESNKNALIREGLTFIIVIPLVYKKKVIGSLNLGSRQIDHVSAQDRLFVESIASRLANLIILVKTQIQLDKSNMELNTRLQELSIKQQMLIQKSRLESLGELSAGLAHEINQPLTVISLVMENINRRIENQQVSGEYFAGKLSTITQNIDKIRKLIEHVRIFSRDQGNISFERVDVNQVIANALSMIDSQLKNNQIIVITNLSEEIGYTIGNPARFEQVILNLVSNARDALEEKEKNTRTGGFGKEIRITTAMEQNRIYVRVWDNGTGISAINTDKIFNPFFTTKAEGMGTGLGLPIVYGIISEMNGEISVRTEERKFTEISINLPMYDKRIK
jgi:PAS domain S-box-containing protein